MQRAVLSVIVFGMLAGCTDVAEREAERLSLACEVARCDCVSNSFLFFDSEPVVWKEDGSASCREGYHLRRLDPAPPKPI